MLPSNVWIPSCSRQLATNRCRLLPKTTAIHILRWPLVISNTTIRYSHSDIQPRSQSSLSSSSSYPPLNFDDVTRSFQSKCYEDLLRALFVYRICTIRPIVAHATQLLQFSRTVLGERMTALLLRHTFFKQFCAGEDAEETAAVVDQLESHGIGGILDYAAESDVTAEKGGTGHQTSASPKRFPIQVPATRSSFSPSPSKQAEWSHNTDLFCSSIIAAGQRKDGFAAIKVTAMGDPDLLTHLSDHILYHKRLFYAIQQQHTSVNHTIIPCIDNIHTITMERFESSLKALHLSLPAAVKQAFLHDMDQHNMKDIDYILYADIFSPFSAHANAVISQSSSSAAVILSEEDMQEFSAIRDRTNRIAQLTCEHQVRLMVDAEQTYLQPAIDLLVLHMQAIGNKGDSSSWSANIPFIYNTYQTYLLDAYYRLLNDEARAEREGWIMAAKIVRGAYMWQERQRARDLNYQDPIQATFQLTTNNYHTSVKHILQQIAKATSGTSSASSRCAPPGLVIAGHNESTVRWASDTVNMLGISRSSPLVFFGQLLGMCDHVSYSLALSGYRVVKVCPYGPINEVLPYLIRRAQENADVLDRATKERKLLWRELIRRTLRLSILANQQHRQATTTTTAIRAGK